LDLTQEREAMSDYSIDGMIRYFEMAHKVMGWTSTDNSYEYQVAQMLKQLRAERDEARREVCGLLVACHTDPDDDKPDPNLKHIHAGIRGWDCFKENSNVKSNT
jgi:hypothetical protein